MATRDWLQSVLAAVGLEDKDSLDPVVVFAQDPRTQRELSELLGRLRLRVHAGQTAEQAWALIQSTDPRLCVIDATSASAQALAFCEKLKAQPSVEHVPVLVCAGEGDAELRVRALEMGAADVLNVPFDASEVAARVSTQVAFFTLVTDLKTKNRELTRELALARATRQQESSRTQVALLGNSLPVYQLRRAIAEQAKSGAALLLLSSPSCGDEAVARAIHEVSARRNFPFFKVRCSELTAEQAPPLLPADAAASTSLSVLEMADGGTLYLDNVDTLPSALQARLAKWCCDNEHMVQGRIDCRLVGSITNPGARFPEGYDQQLAGRFLRNPLSIPALAERSEDIPVLCESFVRRHANALGRPVPQLGQPALAQLKAYTFPGNLRELDELIRRSVIASRGGELAIDPSWLDSDPTLGSYRLTRRLGAGGMGEVWEARHQMLARPAAIKLIKGEDVDVTNRDTLVKRFQREARVTAALTSPHTVKLYDFGVSDKGSFYYVMELLSGIDLEDLVIKHGPMPAPRIASVLLQICASLAEAHHAGLVHRDVKPSNIYLCRQGLEVDFIKVLDFGMVTAQPGSMETRLTKQNRVYGTLGYVSPEGALGKDDLTGKADIYALGCVAYWLMVGKLVFEAKTPMGLLKKHLREPPPLPSAPMAEAPPLALERLVMACLAKAPEPRPSALEVRARLSATGLADGWSAADAMAWWRAHLPEVVNAPTLASLAPTRG